MSHPADFPIVKTTAGEVRGAVLDGVYVFKGIPYAASPAPPNRFMPPQKPTPWRGVRDALNFGPAAMQAFAPTPNWWRILHAGNMTSEGHVRAEDCLVLNLWTSALGDAQKKPVMVWCHGGAFTNGTGDAAWHDGIELARRRDVVVIHFNHRLNVFGFLYLGEVGGDRYADAGNAGMLDIVTVLQWVRDNVGRFGGDAGNVTIFGESGGGAKVATFMAMPAAKGLFHRAIVQSGYPLLRVNSVEEATRTSQIVLDQLRITRNSVDKLQAVSAEHLLQSFQAVWERPQPVWQQLRVFAPVVDGRSLPRHPFDPDAPEVSAEIPMLIGTNRDECGFLHWFNERLFTLDRAQLRAELNTLGISDMSAERVIETYEGSYPGSHLAIYSAPSLRTKCLVRKPSCRRSGKLARVRRPCTCTFSRGERRVSSRRATAWRCRSYLGIWTRHPRFAIGHQIHFFMS